MKCEQIEPPFGNSNREAEDYSQLFMAAGERINIPPMELFGDNVVRPAFAGIIVTAAPHLPVLSVTPQAPRVLSEHPTCSSLPHCAPNRIGAPNDFDLPGIISMIENFPSHGVTRRRTHVARTLM